MKSLYQPFFLFYSLIHIIGGVLIALIPNILGFVLFAPPDQGARLLVAMLSVMVGLGFYGAAYQTDSSLRQMFIKLAIGSNLVNGTAHMVNVAQGNSPIYMAFAGLFGIGAMIGLLMYLYRHETRKNTGE